MKRSIMRIEYEIVHQILISELCFDICQGVKKIPSRGADFLPYYHNLNFIKGIISLHSLLVSTEKDELSIKNYIKNHKKNFPNADISNLEQKINLIADAFKKVSPLHLRHKTAAHIADSFTHIDFVNAYMMPELAEKYGWVAKQLKSVFFSFCNYAQNDDPFSRIRDQSESIIEAVK